MQLIQGDNCINNKHAQYGVQLHTQSANNLVKMEPCSHIFTENSQQSLLVHVEWVTMKRNGKEAKFELASVSFSPSFTSWGPLQIEVRFAQLYEPPPACTQRAPPPWEIRGPIRLSRDTGFSRVKFWINARAQSYYELRTLQWFMFSLQAYMLLRKALYCSIRHKSRIAHKKVNFNVPGEEFWWRNYLLQGQRFIDWKRVSVRGGTGGNGCVSFDKSRRYVAANSNSIDHSTL